MKNAQGDLCLDVSSSPAEWSRLVDEVARLERSQLPVALALGEEFVPVFAASPLRGEA